jgi:hypothetical protein
LSSNIETRYFQSGDEEQIIRVLKSSFPDWATRENPVAYWRWKYIDNTLGSGVEVGLLNGQIICVNHTLNLRVKVGSEIILSHHGDDAATDPNFRGKGYFSSLSDLDKRYKAEHQIKFDYAVPISPVILRKNNRKGMSETPFRVRHLIRVRDVDKYVNTNKIQNRWLYGSGLAFYKLLGHISSVFRSTPKTRSNYQIIDVNHFDEKFDVFWDTIKPNYDFIVEKSSRYLNWRYTHPISGDYKIFAALEGDTILGFIISQVKIRGGFDEGFIVELLFMKERTDIGDSLLKHALRHLDASGVNAVNFRLGKEGLDYSLVLRNGFIDPITAHDFVISAGYLDDSTQYKPLKDFDPQKIHFNYGDYF